MPLILGIDPGLQHTGWGVIETQGNRLKYIACGAVHSNTKSPLSERLLTLHQGLSQVIDCYKPQDIAMEETFINTNARSSLALGHARGALMVAVSLAGKVVYEYPATLVKKTVVGLGRAEKQQVETMVKHLLPGAEITSADAADALAVAICHVSHGLVRSL